LRAEPKIVMVDDHDIELPIAKSMLVIRNDDRVGMVAVVAEILRDADMNIVDLKLGRSRAGGTAMMAFSFDQPVKPGLVDTLLAAPGILGAVAIAEG
jgi:formyltetrahydrofolate hydrolase